MDYVFLNPSPNMEKLAFSLQSMGYTVSRIFTIEYIPFVPEDLWAFAGGSRIRLGVGKEAPDKALTALKKPLFGGMRYKFAGERLSQINPLLSSRGIQDLALFEYPSWTATAAVPKVNDMTIKDAIDRYYETVIVTAMMPSDKGSTWLTKWKTDFDAACALGQSYFFFYTDKGRYELFFHDGEIICISESSATLEWFFDAYPTARKFEFHMTSSLRYNRNLNPWLMKAGKKTYLINDYSWQGVGTVLPEEWLHSLKKMLALNKK